LVRPLKEVHPKGRRVLAVARGKAVRLVEGIPVVGVPQTALHVAPHIVVADAAQIAVNPLAHVGVGQGLGALVNQDVVVEGHVVDLVVGGKGKRLCPNFHADGLALGFRVDVALVVENPVVVLVSVKGHDVFPTAVAAIDFLQEIVPRVVALFWGIEAVAVVIQERRQVVVLVQVGVAVRRIIPEVGGHGVAFGEFLFHGSCLQRLEVLTVAPGVGAGRHEEFVVFVARGGVHLGRPVVGQRSRPKVVAIATVPHGRQLQLLVRADAANPQSTRKHRGYIVLLRHDVSPTPVGALVPQGPAVLDQGADVVPLEVAQGRGRGASRGAGLHLRRVRGADQVFLAHGLALGIQADDKRQHRKGASVERANGERGNVHQEVKIRGAEGAGTSSRDQGSRYRSQPRIGASSNPARTCM